MDKVQKPGDSECYTPSSDPFRISKHKTERHRYNDKHRIEESCRDPVSHPLSRRFQPRATDAYETSTDFQRTTQRRVTEDKNFSQPQLCGSQILQKEVQITQRNRKSRSYDVKLYEGQTNRVRLITPYRSFIRYSSNLSMLL
jgi:hypothetical protein